MKGQAQVKLGKPVVSELELEAILSVTKNKLYVVDEIRFDLPKKTMTILATPY